MVNFFIFQEPFYIFLLVPIILSCLTTSKLYLLGINIIVLLIFDIYYIFSDKTYLDAWLLFGVIIFLFVYRLRGNIAVLLSTSEKISFDGVEKYVYDRDFKLLFTEEEFRLFINIAQMKKSKEKINLAVEGETIHKIFYLVKIPSYMSAVLKAKDTIISYLHEGSWLGVIEFIIHISRLNDISNVPNYEKNKWLVSLSLEKETDEVVYYEWDFISLTNLFNYSNDYKFINKVLLLWIKYLSYSVMRLDDHISNALKAMIQADKDAREKSLPLHRYNTSVNKQTNEPKHDFLEIGEEVSFPLVRKASRLNKVGMNISDMKD